MKKKPTTMKEWGARAGRSGNTRRGTDFEKKIAAELGGAGYAVDEAVISRTMILRRGRPAWTTKKADFFGCIDLTAVRPGDPVLFIQATLDDSRSMMKRKAAEIENVFVCASAGRRVLIVQPYKPDFDDIAGLAAGFSYEVHELVSPGLWDRGLLSSFGSGSSLVPLAPRS